MSVWFTAYLPILRQLDLLRWYVLRSIAQIGKILGGLFTQDICSVCNLLIPFSARFLHLLYNDLANDLYNLWLGMSGNRGRALGAPRASALIQAKSTALNLYVYPFFFPISTSSISCVSVGIGVPVLLWDTSFFSYAWFSSSSSSSYIVYERKTYTPFFLRLPSDTTCNH